MESTYMVTTYDNPWNPFIDFMKWYNYDQVHGYKSLEKVDRLLKSNKSMTYAEAEMAYEKAIDDLLSIDFTGIYRKVDEQSAAELVAYRNSEGFQFLP